MYRNIQKMPEEPYLYIYARLDLIDILQNPKFIKPAPWRNGFITVPLVLFLLLI